MGFVIFVIIILIVVAGSAYGREQVEREERRLKNRERVLLRCPECYSVMEITDKYLDADTLECATCFRKFPPEKYKKTMG